MVETVNVGFDNSTFTFLFDAVFNLTFCFIDHFLDTCRMDTSVSDEFFKSNPCDLTSDLIET